MQVQKERISLAKSLINYNSEGKNILFYSGTFTFKPSIVITNLVENILEDDVSRALKNRCLFLLIEILQNIEKYSHHHSELLDDFIIVNDTNQVLISASNIIQNDDVDKLKAQLEKVDDASLEELSSIFTEKLTNSLSVQGKSPGLGLIEIKRKNKKAYIYDFKQLSNELTRYTITVSIDKNGI